MQGLRGKPHRVIYTAKNFVSGLSQLSLKVICPDLVIKGPFQLTEFEDPFLSGVYYYDHLTSEDDQTGDYIFIINNPEQNHKEGFRLTYQEAQTEALLVGLSEGFQKNYFGG